MLGMALALFMDVRTSVMWQLVPFTWHPPDVDSTHADRLMLLGYSTRHMPGQEMQILWDHSCQLGWIRCAGYRDSSGCKVWCRYKPWVADDLLYHINSDNNCMYNSIRSVTAHAAYPIYSSSGWQCTVFSFQATEQWIDFEYRSVSRAIGGPRGHYIQPTPFEKHILHDGHSGPQPNL